MFEMCRAGLLRDGAGEGHFVHDTGLVVGVGDGERLDAPALAFCKQREVGAGIDATRQEDPDRHVRHFPYRNSVPQLFEELRRKIIFLVSAGGGMVQGVPPTSFLHRSVGADTQQAAGGQLADSGENGLRSGCGQKRQEMEKGLLVDFALLGGVGEEIFGMEQAALRLRLFLIQFNHTFQLQSQSH